MKIKLIYIFTIIPNLITISNSTPPPNPFSNIKQQQLVEPFGEDKLFKNERSMLPGMQMLAGTAAVASVHPFLRRVRSYEF
uniref:Uncharacterized protein n=1 Tax=Meloidogyne hapla TaxID=6305 RepID=A0A1I8BLC6_MELHA